MKKTFLLSAVLALLASSNGIMSMHPNQAQRSALLRKQIGYSILGSAALCLTPAFAASAGATFIFEAAEASQGGSKSLEGTGTGLVLTASSAALSIYSFTRVHRLQKQKKAILKG